MKDKTKRTLAVAAGTLVCAALIVGIAVRFAGQRETGAPAAESSQPNSADVTVNLNEPEPSAEPTLNVEIPRGTEEASLPKPGAGADSTGTEQTIQSAPAKPEAPEPPAPVAEDHTREDVPESERNAETPPTYTPEQTTVTEPEEPDAGSTNGSGAVYVPGFGYIESSGVGTVTHDDEMYENGNKVGVMG